MRHRLDPRRVLARVRHDQRAHDPHTVTCQLCGELADARMTTRLTTDPVEIGVVLAHQYPDRFYGRRALAQKYGEGDAHDACVRAALRGETGVLVA